MLRTWSSTDVRVSEKTGAWGATVMCTAEKVRGPGVPVASTQAVLVTGAGPFPTSSWS